MSDRSLKNAGLNFETVGSIMAIIIGAVALFVAWDQAQVMRQQQHASVWPIVGYDIGFGNDETSFWIEFSLKNEGVGPALMKSADLLVDGKPVADWSDLRSSVFPESLGNVEKVYGGSVSDILGAGQSDTPLKIFWDANEENSIGMRTLVEQYLADDGPTIEIAICYCSVFDRCWSNSDATGGMPQRTTACRVQQKDFAETLFTNFRGATE
ncbi:MAG: hypothetical protein AAFX54_04890 [Pseudomonadota bacterium]